MFGEDAEHGTRGACAPLSSWEGLFPVKREAKCFQMDFIKRDGLGFRVGGIFGIEFTGLPGFAEEFTTEEVDAFTEVEGSVLFEGVVEGLDGTLPTGREGWRCGRFLKGTFHPGNLARERKRRKVVTTYKSFMKKSRIY